LAIYYNELRYESVAQQEAYDIGTLLSECLSPHHTLLTAAFAGEVGGYMGLLLGGSCITLIELLDLIVYNCCCKRSRNKEANIPPV
jgi:hypothetical protein